MLIKCPECGKDVSDKAKSCPNCGYSLKKDKKSTNPIAIVIGTIVVVIIVIIAIMSIARKKVEEEIIEEFQSDLETVFDDKTIEYEELPVLGMNEEFVYNGGTVKILSVDLAEEEYQSETDIDELLIAVTVECKNTSNEPINNPVDDLHFEADYDHSVATIQFDNYSFPDLQPNETVQRKIYVFMPMSAMKLTAYFAPPEDFISIASFKLDFE